MRTDWARLPDTVTAEIAARVGGPFTMAPAAAGDHAEIAATVTGPQETIFVKAASAEPGIRSLRYELAATTAIDRYPPTVRWHFQAAGWLVMGAEHLPGPHPDLSPGSPDLDLLAATVKDLQETPAPDLLLFTPAARLGFTHPAMDGTSLIHSDLNPTNLILTPNGVRIVDWAWTTRAAPWVELALLVQWLIGSGHAPGQAEEWLAQFTAWTNTEPKVLDYFSSKNAAKWAAKAHMTTENWVQDLAAWTGRWAEHRLKRR